jgi:hypothetical protein
VRFPQAGVANEHNGLLFADIFATEQVKHLGLVEGGQGREVKVSQFLERRSVGLDNFQAKTALHRTDCSNRVQLIGGL